MKNTPIAEKEEKLKKLYKKKKHERIGKFEKTKKPRRKQGSPYRPIWKAPSLKSIAI